MMRPAELPYARFEDDLTVHPLDSFDRYMLAKRQRVHFDDREASADERDELITGTGRHSSQKGAHKASS